MGSVIKARSKRTELIDVSTRLARIFKAPEALMKTFYPKKPIHDPI